MNPVKIREAIKQLTDEECLVALYDWYGIWAREKQHPPEWDWNTWLLLAGRGFGKTRTGSELVRLWSEQFPIIHLVGATAGDVRDIMIEGPAGILSVFPTKPRYEPSKRKITFPSGSVGILFSAEEPDRLRGPQCYKAWADELAAWKYPEAWDQLQFGLRLGEHPQVVVTTTPRPTSLIKELVKDPKTAITKGNTFENKSNLAKSFIDNVIRKYEGTILGRQELYAEVLEDIEGALWKMKTIEKNRIPNRPEMERIVVAIDPAASEKADSDETGLVVVGTANKKAYILEDESGIYSPEGWAQKAIDLYNKYEANYLLAEKNNGGDMVGAIIRGRTQSVPFRLTWASRGKKTRAEPVAAFYERDMVKHVGAFPKLENEMTTWVSGSGQRSPNRIDAMVWGVTELLISRRVGTGGSIMI